MFWVGSLMSQVLQWTQFCALIWRRSVPSPFFTNSYTPAEQGLLDSDHHGPGVESLGHPLLEVARAVQLVEEPRFLERRPVSVELVCGSSRPQRDKRGLRCEHAGLDRRVAAFYSRGVEESRFVADKAAARKRELRQRHQAAGGDGARAVGDALAAFEERADARMGLVALEFLVRIEVRVGVGESDDKAHRHESVFHVIEERPAVGARVQGPAGRVNDESRLVLFRFDLPEFLQTDAVYLRIRVRIQAIALHQLPAQMPAAALGEKDVLAVQLDPRLILVGRPAVASHAHVAGGDAANAALVVVEHFRGGKAGVDLDAQRFGLLPEPAAHVAEADDVVAVVPEAFGKEKTRHAERAG